MAQRVLMIFLILAIVFGGGFYAYKQLVPPPVQEAQGPVYSTKPVTRGDISVGVDVTGSLNPSRSGGIQAPGSNEYSAENVQYILSEILAQEGDEVKQGQVIAKLVAPGLQAQIDSLESEIRSNKEYLSELTGLPTDKVYEIKPGSGITLRAPIDGRVTELSIKEGTEVPQGQIVAKIVDDSTYRIKAKLYPNEFEQVKKGQKLAIRFTVFDGIYYGYITEVNPNPIPDGDDQNPARGFVYWITVEGKNPGLVRANLEAWLGIPSPDNDETKVRWFANNATVDGFAKEEKVLATAEAIASTVYVRQMDLVKKGDPLVLLSGSDIEDTIQEKLDKIRDKEKELANLLARAGQTEIRASMDGIIAHWEKQAGETVGPREWLGYIFNTSDMEMWAQVDDVDVLLVKQGAPVKVTLDALPGETFDGEVSQVETMGKAENGIPQFGLYIRVKGGPKLRPGMQAHAHIDAGSAKNVLLVPLEAIFEEDNTPKVEILNKDGTTKVVTVKLGLMNDKVAEVQSGVDEGELVITGSSADVLPSQHIGSKDTLLPGNKEETTNNDKSSDSNKNKAPAGK
ncbi:MAG: efflux RND transporter periplasmic adaptor subunit [Tepidanaerobacteraceae bacterium]|jgi:multidrug efflux pump subunit AcrA (membrane-fusion protein)|nr:efflux RND transporter periplasmic adaptor subunit [Tepidanaerobacteraceae bacterium]